MRSIQPDYSHRFDIENIRDSYNSLEDAFAQGDYNLVAEFAEDGSELLGEALVLTGLLDQGVEVLDRLPELSPRGVFHRAFAAWYLDESDDALRMLGEVPDEHELAPMARELAALIGKPTIKMFNIAPAAGASPINPGETDIKLSKPHYRLGQFEIKMVGTAREKNAYDYSFNEPLDELIDSLPDDERPDFIMSMITQWFVPKNLDKVDIPTVIWHHDQDLFIYRFYNNYFAHDVHLLYTSQEHYELSRAFGKFCVTHLLADVFAEPFPAVERSQHEERAKDIDLLFTGSSISSSMGDKPSFLFKVLTEAKHLKTLVVHGHLPWSQYDDLMSRAKSMPIISRMYGNASPRWKDILTRGGLLLYPFGTTFGRICKGAVPYRTESIASDIERHVSQYNQPDAGPGYQQGEILADSENQMAQFRQPRVDREKRLERFYRYAAFLTILQRHRPQKARLWQDGKTAPRQRVWPMPALDPYAFGWPNMLDKIFAALRHESVAELVEDKDYNNKAVILFTILILMRDKQIPEYSRLIKQVGDLSEGLVTKQDVTDGEYDTPLKLIAQGLECHPYSLLLRFNQALFHSWPSFGPYYLGDQRANIEHRLSIDGIALFESLIEEFDTLDFDPFGSDIGIYSKHLDDPVFPYSEYGSMVTIAAVQVDDQGRIQPDALAELRSVLLSAAHGYIGRHFFERGLNEQALPHLRSAQNVYKGNKKLARLKFLVGLELYKANEKANEKASTELMSELADDYFRMASLDPAVSMDEVDEIAFILAKLRETAELERLLHDWYYFARGIHMGELGRPMKQDEMYYISLLQFEDLFPPELRENLVRIRKMTPQELEADENLSHVEKWLGRFVVPGGKRPSFLLRLSLRRQRGKRFLSMWLTPTIEYFIRKEQMIIYRLAAISWLRRLFHANKKIIRRLPLVPERIRILLHF